MPHDRGYPDVRVWPGQTSPSNGPKDGQNNVTPCRRYLGNKVFLTQVLSRRPLNIWIFIANITNVFTLELDILRTYDACVDLGCEGLHLEEEEVSLWILVAGPGVPAR